MADDSSNYHRRIYPKQKTVAKGFYVMSRNIVPHSTPARNGQPPPPSPEWLKEQIAIAQNNLHRRQAEVKTLQRKLKNAAMRENGAQAMVDHYRQLYAMLFGGER